jgi:hypothetical protein
MPKLVNFNSREEKEAIISYLRTKNYATGLSKFEKRSLRRRSDLFILLGDDLCYNGEDGPLKVVCPYETDLINHIIKTEHNLSHMGINKMVDLINKKYYGINKEKITEYVNACESCRHFNSIQTIQPAYVNDITKKYDLYMMDCVDLRKYSNQNDDYGWILNVIDTYTKYLWSFKLKNKTASAIKDSLEFIFDNFGEPVSIQSDNGKEFKNELLRSYFNDLNIKIIHGRPRNPKAQGQVERVNQTIKRWLSKKLFDSNRQRWIDHHATVVRIYNRSIHRATTKSPFKLFFNHQGFNVPLSSGEFIENETGLHKVDPALNMIQNNEILTELESEIHSNDCSNFTKKVIKGTIGDHNQLFVIKHDDGRTFEYINGIITTYIDNKVVSNEPWNVDGHLFRDAEISSDFNEKLILKNDSDMPDDPEIEVMKHFKKYKQKTIDNMNSNLIKKELKVGDLVLLKKDFDMNPDTKKAPFDSFFEKDNFEVVALLTNNMVQIKDTNNDSRTVFKGVIKKI